jgi:hypothetical protein
MSIVTYRGVKYDTQIRKSTPHETHKVQEVYRGVKHTEAVEVSK